MSSIYASAQATTESRSRRSRRGAEGCVTEDYDFTKLHPEENMTEHMVCAFLKCSPSFLWNKLQKGNPYADASFPKPHSLKGEAKAGNATRWRARLIMDWNREQSEQANLDESTKST